MVEAAFTLADFRASDGYTWKYRRYATKESPRGHVVFLHGIQSHGGWYTHSCTELANAGYEVHFLDRRGSGLNTQDRGDCPGFRRLIDDVAEFLTALPRSVARGHGSAPIPVFLAAISWGGKLALALERRHPGLVDGVALLCPGIVSRIRLSFLQRFWIFACRLFRPRALFPIPLNDPELFTANPQWLEFLRNDPLRLHQATARFLLESARLDAYLNFVPKYFIVPILLMLAEHDKIIHNAKTRKFIDLLATNDKQVIEYPAAHHTLEFEPDPSAFVNDLLTWLDQHNVPREESRAAG